MADMLVGFVDAFYLRAQGASVIGKRSGDVHMNASAVVDWLRKLAADEGMNQSFLRAYWYEGAFEPSHQWYDGQRQYFHVIARTPGIQLRLGHIVERPSPLAEPIRQAVRKTARSLEVSPDRLQSEFDRNWTFPMDRQQKGVDTLIALDMVRLAGRSAYSTAVLVSGDQDFAEVIRTVQDFGVRALIATPNPATVARDLTQLADGLIVIDADAVRNMLPLRPSPD